MRATGLRPAWMGKSPGVVGCVYEVEGGIVVHAPAMLAMIQGLGQGEAARVLRRNGWSVELHDA